MGFFSNLFNVQDEGVADHIKNGARIIDVRTPAEFASGHISFSENIPLDTIPSKLDNIKNYDGAIVMVCRSGNRSKQAVNFLKSKGVENIYNGGSWDSVNELLP